MIAATRPAPRRAPSLGRRLRGSFLSSAAGLAASLASTVALTRYVDPAEYGRVALVTAMWGLCGVAIDWDGDTVVRHGPLELARSGSLRTTVSTRLALTAPALLLLLVGTPLYFGLVRGWPPSLLWLGEIYFIAYAAIGIARWSAVAAQRFAPLALSSVLVRAAPLAAILVLHAARRPIPARVLIVATVGGLVAGSVPLLAALRPLLGLVRPDRALLRAMWRYSRPVLFAAPSVAITTYIDPIILRRSVSHADVGRYQLAYLVVTLFGMAGASFNGVLSPELVSADARRDPGTVERYRRRLQPALALALGLVAFAGACVMSPLAAALPPARWAAAADSAALLAVAGGLLLATWTFHPLVTATDSTAALQIAVVAGALVNVALDFVLAPRFGTTGVALANVAAWAAQLTLLSLLLHRRIGARRSALALLPVALAVVLLLVGGVRVGVRALVAVVLVTLAAAPARRARLTRCGPAS